MNILRSRRYITKLVLSIVLPFLVMVNFGPTPTLASSAAFPVPISPSKESPGAVCPPSITFTHKPPIGSLEEFLYGRADCVNPADFKVAVYIYVEGWWTKPTWANSLTLINPDGTWKADVVTAPTDHLAVKYAAFLIPNNVINDTFPPKLGGNPELPGILFTQSAANVIEARRTIEFSGFTWNVKATAINKAGPGPNYFSADPNDIWVDGSGNLHLTISEKNGKWYATEIYSTAPLGYGTYTFTLASPVDQLDKNAVLGLFTWDDATPANNYREIDIEFSRWGQDLGDNAQYVVQPFGNPGNRHQFPMTLTGPFSTHSFKWLTGQISFTSHQGELPNLGAEIQSWLYTGADVPQVGTGNARINLWLFNGLPPSNGQRIEVVIKAFRYPTVFSDIPSSYWAWTFIQSLYDAGITGGCGTSPLIYCPESSVTRAEMAVFLEKGIHGSAFSPINIAPTFTDTVGHWAEDWIEALKTDGITGGCGTNIYCPQNPVTRDQMAVFLLKAKHGSSYTPPPVGPSTGFSDVPVTHWAAPWIKQLAAEGITGGCGSGTYCPGSSVTRAEMAVFLVRTFNLP